jgi:glycosyltransferase involved in cell wall biosynthesis
MNAPSNTPPRPLPHETLLSIVLPVYNEAQVLPVLAGRITKALWNSNVAYEMIFVNDGSCDKSGEILDQLAAHCSRIRVVHLARNFGHQAAVHAGLAHARGDAVVLMDSDLQDVPEAIPEMLRRWQAGEDVVYALRVQRKEGGWKRLGFAAFHRLMARVATIPIPADAGIFGLIDRRVAQWILNLPERDRYFPGLRSWVGFRQSGMEVERQARYDETSRVSLRGLFHLAKTAIFSFSTLPLTIFHVIGMVAAAVFLGLGSYALFCKFFTHLALPGWTSHILLGSFFGALNALGISILGEYVIRIYDQVRGRPLYLVDRTVNISEVTASGDSEKTRVITPLPASWAEDHDDQPYVELMREAEELMQAGDQAARQSRAATPVPERSPRVPAEMEEEHNG